MCKTSRRAAYAALALIVAALGGEPRPGASGAEPAAPPGGAKGDHREWGTPVNNQAISIAMEKATYAPVEPVILRIVYKNVGKDAVEVAESNSFAQIYHIKVTMGNGRECPWTEYAKREYDIEPSALFGWRFKPGHEAMGRWDVARRFDLSLVARYSVVVEKRILMPDNSWSTAVSNKVWFVIDTDDPGRRLQRGMGRAAEGWPVPGARPGAKSGGAKTDQRKWGTPVNGLALSVATENAEYGPVEAVFVRVVAKNVGSREIVVREPWSVDRMYHLKVALENGRECPRTEVGKRAYDDVPTAGFSLRLKPGEERANAFELAARFDLSMNGLYTVVVETPIRMPDGSRSAAVSNKVEFTIDDDHGHWLEKRLKEASKGSGDAPAQTPAGR